MQVRQMLAAQQPRMNPAVGVCVGLGAAVVVGALVGVFMTRPSAVGLRQSNNIVGRALNTDTEDKLTGFNQDLKKFRSLGLDEEESDFPLEKVPGMTRTSKKPVYKPKPVQRNKYTPMIFDPEVLQLNSFKQQNKSSKPTSRPILTTAQIRRGINAAATGVHSTRTQLAPVTRNDWQFPLLHGHINQQSTRGSTVRTKTLWEELA